MFKLRTWGPWIDRKLGAKETKSKAIRLPIQRIFVQQRLFMLFTPWCCSSRPHQNAQCATRTFRCQALLCYEQVGSWRFLTFPVRTMTMGHLSNHIAPSMQRRCCKWVPFFLPLPKMQHLHDQEQEAQEACLPAHEVFDWHQVLSKWMQDRQR